MKMKKELRIKVADELNKHFTGDLFTENKVKKFKLINKFSSKSDDYDIYATQMGDLTIMVWINGDHIVVHAQPW